jgi:hypothetical protein
MLFLGEWLLAPSPNPQTGGPHLSLLNVTASSCEPGNEFYEEQAVSRRTEPLILPRMTVPNGVRFDLREISSSHGGEYDVQSCLLGYHP